MRLYFYVHGKLMKCIYYIILYEIQYYTWNYSLLESYINIGIRAEK